MLTGLWDLEDILDSRKNRSKNTRVQGSGSVPAPCNGIRIPEFVKFLLVESGILLKIGIQNPTSTDKDWNPVPEIRNPRMSWFSLHGTKLRNTCEIFLLFLHSYKYLFEGFFVAVLFPTDGLYC